MTYRDSRTSSGRRAGDRAFECASPAVAVEVSTGGVEQAHHGLAAMVARDVGVQILPDALDAVRVGAIGRQEVENDSAAERGEDLAGAMRLGAGVGVDGAVKT